MKTYFVVGTVNGTDLDWWPFSTIEEARLFLSYKLFPEKYGILTFYTPEAAWYFGEYDPRLDRFGG